MRARPILVRVLVRNNVGSTGSTDCIKPEWTPSEDARNNRLLGHECLSNISGRSPDTLLPGLDGKPRARLLGRAVHVERIKSRVETAHGFSA
jgi:hypothetical protein